MMMNNSYKSAVLIIPFIVGLIITACTHEIENVFEESASNRVSAAVKEYRELLVSSKNGWLMEYYAEGKDRSKIGGFNMFLNFEENGEVVIMSDHSSGAYKEGTSIKSQYEVKSDQIVMLTFNTYNPILHYYCEPHGSSDVNGYQGDYEFYFKEVTENEIILEGKKVGLTIRMTRIAKDADVDSMLEKMVQTRYGSFYPYFQLLVNDSPVDTIVNDNQHMYLSTENLSIDENFIYTADGGIKFYKPIVINGDSVQIFSWNSENNSFVGKGSKSDIRMEKALVEGYHEYDYFLGDFLLSYNGGTRDILIVENVYFESYLIKGLFDGLDVLLKYDAFNGITGINSQKIKPYEGNYIAVCGWDSKAGYFNSSSSVGGKFIQDEEDSNKFHFVDNGYWSKYNVNALILWIVTENSRNVGAYTGVKPNRLAGPITITKK